VERYGRSGREGVRVWVRSAHFVVGGTLWNIIEGLGWSEGAGDDETVSADGHMSLPFQAGLRSEGYPNG
jgi:hypothetical protein